MDRCGRTMGTALFVLPVGGASPCRLWRDPNSLARSATASTAAPQRLPSLRVGVRAAFDQGRAIGRAGVDALDEGRELRPALEGAGAGAGRLERKAHHDVG